MSGIFLFLIAGCASAQTPAITTRRDSIPDKAIRSMPAVRPDNSFYRDPNDPPRVLRATLDNMPVKGPDSSVQYTMQQKPDYRSKSRPRKR